MVPGRRDGCSRGKWEYAKTGDEKGSTRAAVDAEPASFFGKRRWSRADSSSAENEVESSEDPGPIRVDARVAGSAKFAARSFEVAARSFEVAAYSFQVAATCGWSIEVGKVRIAENRARGWARCGRRAANMTRGPTRGPSEVGCAHARHTACIRMCLSPAEHEYVSGKETSKEVWDLLLERHRKEDRITQVSLFEQVFALHFSHSTPLPETSSKIRDLVRHIYTIGVPDEEAFLQICLLSALGLPEFRTIRESLSTLFPTSTLSSTTVLKRLDDEQEVIEREKLSGTRSAPAGSESAHVSTAKQFTPKKTPCPNCKLVGHGFPECFAPGGGSEGQKPQWMKLRDAERAQRKVKKPTSNARANVVYDGGKAYLATYMPIEIPTTTTEEHTAVSVTQPPTEEEYWSCVTPVVASAADTSDNWRERAVCAGFRGTAVQPHRFRVP